MSSRKIIMHASASALLLMSSCIGTGTYGDEMTGLWEVKGFQICEDGFFAECPSGNYSFVNPFGVMINQDVDADGYSEYVHETLYYKIDSGKNYLYFALEVADDGDPMPYPLIDGSGNEHYYRQGVFGCEDYYYEYSIDEAADKIYMNHSAMTELAFRYEKQDERGMRLIYLNDESQYIDLEQAPNGRIYGLEMDCSYQIPGADAMNVTNGGDNSGDESGYSVTYNSNGASWGDPPAGMEYYNAGDQITLPGNDGLWVYSLDGLYFEFIGWNTKADGTGVYYYPGDYYIILEKDINFYASWSALRATGPSGGYVFYDRGSYSDGWRYMEVAGSGAENADVAWGGAGYTFNNTFHDIGMGYANTNIAATLLDSIPEYLKAAQLCRDMNYGGYSDWFLPSLDELDKIYINLSNGEDENGIDYTPVESFSSGAYYWSSSRYDYNDQFSCSYNVNLYSGAQNCSNPVLYTGMYARPVRRF